MFQRTEGIVIRTIDYGETNKIVTLYTREFGKIGMVARGAKKPKSRLTAISQLFIYGNFLFQKGTGLGTLQQGEIINSFKEVRNDLFRASYASYIVELTDKLTEEKERNPFLFELLFQTLSFLNEEMDPEILTRIYEVKMLQVAGIAPQLNCCVSCGATEGNFSFSFTEGGFLCQTCKHSDAHVLEISSSTVKLLRLFYHLDMKRIGTISVREETKQELKNVLHTYYEQYSGLMLKSKRFLEQLEKLNWSSKS